MCLADARVKELVQKILRPEIPQILFVLLLAGTLRVHGKIMFIEYCVKVVRFVLDSDRGLVYPASSHEGLVADAFLYVAYF
jgi:hypothetical protein